MSTLPFAPPFAPGPADDLLIPFNPTRGFDLWWEHLELHASADPKVAAARKLLEQRLRALPETDLETVASVLWAVCRLSLRAGRGPRWFRAWLGDGDGVLRTVEAALDSLLTSQALRELARAGGQLESSDRTDADDVGRARAEVHTFVAADFGPGTVLAVAAGAGLVLLALEAEALIHGHPGPDIVVYGHGRS